MSDDDLPLADTIVPGFADDRTQTLASTVLGPEGQTVVSDDFAWQPGDVILEEYQVCRTLGSGGMGRVYLVRNRLSGQEFAVKSAHVDDAQTRRRFLRELRTWLDLPEHPNLTACRFYRTVEGRVVIFADYVAGGTLGDWMKNGRLDDVPAIVDVAIQVARGLQIAHARDLIHRDVKPGNILMSETGVAKVTDFGLAGAVDTSIAGMTPAYCSPEQAFRDQPIRYGSDVWSWAATVLQMFTREIMWPNGAMLGIHLSRIVGEPLPIAIPAEIETLLGRCFASSTDERPKFDLLIARLEELYARFAGTDYPRANPLPEPSTQSRHVASTSTGWATPGAWFEESRRSQVTASQVDAISDLGMFEDALDERRALLEREDRPALREEIALLLSDKAKVHRHGGDFPGALNALAAARDILPDGHPQTLATVLAVEGIVLVEMTRYAEAEEPLREALEIRAELRGPFNALERVEIQRQLARTAFFRRDFEGSIVAAEAALSLLDEIDLNGQVDLVARRRAHALTLSTLATAQSKLNTETARDTLREAVRMGEDLVVLDGEHDFREDLAKAYFNLAVCDRKLGDVEAAIETYGRVARLQEQLISTGERDDLVDDLAMTHSNLSFAHRFAEQLDRARHHADRAIGLRERLVHLRGRRDLRDRLAASYVARSYVAAKSERWNEAVEFGRLATNLREHLVYEEDRHDLEARLAGLYGSIGGWLEEQGKTEQAVVAHRRGIEIREARIARGDPVKRGMLVELYLRLARCTTDQAEADTALQSARDLLDAHSDLEMSEQGADLVSDFGLA